jgi:hypothetical protein
MKTSKDEKRRKIKFESPSVSAFKVSSKYCPFLEEEAEEV